MIQNNNFKPGKRAIHLIEGKTKMICDAYLDWSPVHIFGGYKSPERGHCFEYAPAGTIAPRSSISVWGIKFSNEQDAEITFNECFGISPDTAYLVDRKKGIISDDHQFEIILNVEELSDKAHSYRL